MNQKDYLKEQVNRSKVGLFPSHMYVNALSCFLIYLGIKTAETLGDDCVIWLEKMNRLAKAKLGE